MRHVVFQAENLGVEVHRFLRIAAPISDMMKALQQHLRLPSLTPIDGLFGTFVDAIPH